MRLIGAILVGPTTYAPGQEAELLGGEDRNLVDWAQLEQAGIVEFADEADRLAVVDPEASEDLGEAEVTEVEKPKAAKPLPKAKARPGR